RHTRSKRDWSSDVCSSDLIKVFTGSIPEIPLAMNIGAPPGGDAPSVEENTKMTTAAITGLTPAATSVLNATAPIAVTVAVAVKGVATNMTKIPTNNATSHLSKSREFMKLPNCSGNPSCLKISLAEKEKSRMTPITLKLFVEPSKR